MRCLESLRPDSRGPLFPLRSREFGIERPTSTGMMSGMSCFSVRCLFLSVISAVALWGLGGTGVSIASSPGTEAGTRSDPVVIRYGRDIRPILSDRCFLCHGPDRETQAVGLRLDNRAEAIADRDGMAAIVPGDPDASLLIERITESDPADLMPPPDSGKHALTADEVDLIRNWIKQGAVYEKHWAFERPTRPRSW